jgi:hypothetical protein
MTPRTTPRIPPPRASAWWLYVFLLVQFVCQGALVSESIGSLRIVFRATAFLSSLALLVVLPPGGRPYPVRGLAIAAVVITALGLLHPGLNSATAGVASLGLTLAVWAPVIWAARLNLTANSFRRVILLLWAFHSASAAVGVLQVYYPSRFAPDPAFIRQQLGDYADGLIITLDDGRQVYRPMGLSDSPGGAATSGMFAVLAGLGVALLYGNVVLRLVTLPAGAVGMFCIYICQVRSVLVITVVGLVGILALIAARGRADRIGGLAAVAAVAVVGGYIWANTIGQEVVTGRLATLTQDSAVNVYYSHRGVFLEDALTDTLPTYPLGAGLGRWGMMYAYFGDKTNPESPMLWAEIQPAAWVLDGGLPLLVVGYAALLWACWVSGRIAFTARSQQVSDLAAVVTAINFGMLVSTFGYPMFASQGGILFWVLNAALFAVAQREGGAPRRPRPAAPPGDRS